MDKSIYGHDYTSPYHIFEETKIDKKPEKKEVAVKKNATVKKEAEAYHETYY